MTDNYTAIVQNLPIANRSQMGQPTPLQLLLFQTLITLAFIDLCDFSQHISQGITFLEALN